MARAAIEELSVRAEDKALLGSNLSAGPGAKTEGRAARSLARLSPLRDWHQSDKSLAAKPRAPDVKTPRGRLSEVANSGRPELHFTLNH